MAKDKQVKIELIVPKDLKDMLESAAKERGLELDELLIYGAQEYMQNNPPGKMTDEEFITLLKSTTKKAARAAIFYSIFYAQIIYSNLLFFRDNVYVILLAFCL